MIEMGEKKVVNRNIAYALGVLCVILVASTAGVVVYPSSSDNNNNYADSHSHSDSEYAALTAQLAATNENISSLISQLSALQKQVANNTSNQTTNLYARIDALTTQLMATNSSVKTIQDYYNSLLYVYSTDNHDLAVNLTTANNQIASLQDQINTFTAISNLTVSMVWINNQTVTQTAGNYTVWSESASYAGYVSIRVSSSTTNNTYANVTYTSHGVNYNNQINVGTSGTAYFPILPSTNISVAVGNSLPSGTATENVTITYFY
jgi:hypothetical protein